MRYLLALTIAALLPSCRPANPPVEYFVPCFYTENPDCGYWHFCKVNERIHVSDTASYSNCYFLLQQKKGFADWQPAN